MIKNNLMAMAVAASIEAMQHLPENLATTGHRISGNIGFNGFNRHQAKNKSYRRKSVSKYKSHQGKQECARRLRIYSAAWYSRANAMKLT